MATRFLNNDFWKTGKSPDNLKKTAIKLNPIEDISIARIPFIVEFILYTFHFLSMNIYYHNSLYKVYGILIFKIYESKIKKFSNVDITTLV